MLSSLIIRQIPSRYQLLGAFIIGGTLFVFNIHRKKKEQEEKEENEKEDDYLSDEDYSRKCFEKEKDNSDDESCKNGCSYDGEDYECKSCEKIKKN